MEWAFLGFFAVMIGLYIWSHLTAGHAISQKLQPYIDDLFGQDQKPERWPHPTKATEAIRS